MKAAIDMRRRALMVLMVAILAIAAAMTNGLTSAESAGTSFPFIVFAGPPGSPAQVYNGHYWGEQIGWKTSTTTPLPHTRAK